MTTTPTYDQARRALELLGYIGDMSDIDLLLGSRPGRLLLAVAINAAAKADPDLYQAKAGAVVAAICAATAWWGDTHAHGAASRVVIVQFGSIEAAFHFTEAQAAELLGLLKMQAFPAPDGRRWCRVALQNVIRYLIDTYLELGEAGLARAFAALPRIPQA